MKKESIELDKLVTTEFVPCRTLSELWEKFHILNEKLFTELYPKEEIPSRKSVELGLKNTTQDHHLVRKLIFRDKTKQELIGWYSYSWIKRDSVLYEQNKAIGEMEIFIDKEYRRHGIGSKILKEIALELKEKGCLYIKNRTKYLSGMKFCEKLGAKTTNIGGENRLLFDSIDWKLVDDWIKEGKRRNPETTIEGFWGVSEEDIEEFCVLLTELFNEAPTLEEENEEFTAIITPATYKEFVANLEKGLNEIYTFRSREADGKISGLTENYFSKRKNSHLIRTGLTGVKSPYRGKGIGKWLKAEMLLFIKENYPLTKVISTGNASHNEPMLAINKRLGFKPFLQRKTYKFIIDELLQNLQL